MTAEGETHRCRLARSLSSELLTGSLTTSRLAGCLLSTSHRESSVKVFRRR